MASASSGSILRRSGRIAAAFLALGLAAADDPKPTPHWVHVKYDTAYEKWVCLDDGRRLSKTDEVAILDDPVAGFEWRWDAGEDRITRRTAFKMADGSRPDPAALREMMTREFSYPQIDQHVPKPGQPPPVNEVFGGNFDSIEYTPETLDGRRCLRMDLFKQDPADGARLERQTWVDLETKRPIRTRERLIRSHQIKFQREFRTGTYEFTATGPGDLIALGFPKGLPVVDIDPPKPEALPADLRRALEGASAAIARLPRDLRIVAEEGNELKLIYWSSPETFLRKLAKHVIDQEDMHYQLGARPRLSITSREGFDMGVDGAQPAIPPVPGGDALAELSDARLAALFSLEAASEIELDDGARAILVDKDGLVGPDGKPRDRVLVRDGRPEPPGLPEPLVQQWPFTWWDRKLIRVVAPEPGTPPGQVVLQMEKGGGRHRWYCDPDRGFVAVREVIESKDGGAWKVHRDARASRWKPLPGGTWYVAEWEVHLGPGKDDVWTHRIEVTPLPPGGFPPDTFDAGKLIDAFKARGAKIEVD
jgi:hypothetical protein